MVVVAVYRAVKVRIARIAKSPAACQSTAAAVIQTEVAEYKLVGLQALQGVVHTNDGGRMRMDGYALLEYVHTTV